MMCSEKEKWRYLVPKGPIKCDKFLDYLGKYLFLNKDTSLSLSSHLCIILPNSPFA